jgi:hypothetical protein
MSRKLPWLKKGITLDQRIGLGLPEVMKIVQPENASPWGSVYTYRWQHVQACRKYTIGKIRALAEMDVVTPRVRREALLNAATKVREAQEAVAALPYRDRDADVLGALADVFEVEARRIPLGRAGAGGSPQARADKVRKLLCADLAHDLLSADWSSIGADRSLSTTKHKLLDYFACLLFQIATGRKGSVTKALKEYFKENDIKAFKPPPRVEPKPKPGPEEEKLIEIMEADTAEKYAEWNKPKPYSD